MRDTQVFAFEAFASRVYAVIGRDGSPTSKSPRLIEQAVGELGLDSLTFLELCLLLEEVFGISCGPDELHVLKSMTLDQLYGRYLQALVDIRDAGG